MLFWGVRMGGFRVRFGLRRRCFMGVRMGGFRVRFGLRRRCFMGVGMLTILVLV